MLPIAALTAVIAARSLHGGRELLGLIAGAGAVLILIGSQQLGYSMGPCRGTAWLTGPGAVESEGCGGFGPVPWLAAGTFLATASLVGYGLGRGR